MGLGVERERGSLKSEAYSDYDSAPFLVIMLTTLLSLLLPPLALPIFMFVVDGLLFHSRDRVGRASV